MDSRNRTQVFWKTSSTLNYWAISLALPLEFLNSTSDLWSMNVSQDSYDCNTFADHSIKSQCEKVEHPGTNPATTLS